MTELRPDGLNALLEQSRAFGFLGPGPVQRHRSHAEAFLPLLPTVGTIVDLGSGGGVPGLVLALARPELQFVLIDAMERRTTFLAAAIGTLGLRNVEVLTGRAEDLGRGARRSSCAAVVSRSFGPPAVVAECAAPFLIPGGLIIVAEPDMPQPGRWPDEGLSLLGLEKAQVVSEPVHLQVLRAVSPCPETFPRRTGVPKKRPLW